METSLPLEKAQTIVRHYLCSDCWETLAAYDDPNTRKSSVRCATQDCPCRGYVRREFVERRKVTLIGWLSTRIHRRTAVPSVLQPGSQEEK